MKYGSLEYAYAAPIAAALVHNAPFRSWVLKQTKFAAAAQARLLDKEMSAARRAATWWRSHYTESCRCPGCSGQETDLLAIFESPEGRRFALHFEVKQPTDRFTPGAQQALNYRRRAECWVAKPPRSVLRHEEAATVLICSASSLDKFAIDAAHFDRVMTFEAIRAEFPLIPIPTER